MGRPIRIATAVVSTLLLFTITACTADQQTSETGPSDSNFVSSEAQISAAETDESAALIADKKIPVIFQDNLTNPEAIEHLQQAVQARGWTVEVSDTPLFADSLGKSAPTDTYLSAFSYNVLAISQENLAANGVSPSPPQTGHLA